MARGARAVVPTSLHKYLLEETAGEQNSTLLLLPFSMNTLCTCRIDDSALDVQHLIETQTELSDYVYQCPSLVEFCTCVQALWCLSLHTFLKRPSIGINRPIAASVCGCLEREASQAVRQ